MIATDVFKSNKNIRKLSAALDEENRWQDVLFHIVPKNHQEKVLILCEKSSRGLKFIEILLASKFFNITWGEFKRDAKKANIEDIDKVENIEPNTLLQNMLLAEKKAIARVITINNRWKDLATDVYKFSNSQIKLINNCNTIEKPTTERMFAMMTDYCSPLTMKELAHICFELTYYNAVSNLKEIGVAEMTQRR